jgi:hypothetical protein
MMFPSLSKYKLCSHFVERTGNLIRATADAAKYETESFVLHASPTLAHDMATLRPGYGSLGAKNSSITPLLFMSEHL